MSETRPVLTRLSEIGIIITGIFTTIGVGFGICAYFYTVHPVFEKESELLDAKMELEEIRQKGVVLNKDIKAKEEELNRLKEVAQERQKYIAYLKQESARQSAELAVKSREAHELRKRVNEVFHDAVYAHVLRLMDGIADDALDAIVNKGSKFDLKTRCVEVASEGIKKKGEDAAEHKAYLILKSYAENVLSDGIKNFEGLHEIMVYTRFDQRAIEIINQN